MMSDTAIDQRLMAELARLRADERKLRSETTKLRAESRKYQRETLLYPMVVGAALFAAGASFSRVVAVLATV